MVSATVTLAFSGSTVLADLVELTKVSMESHANAMSATLLMSTETALSPTSSLPAIKTKGTTRPSRPASASQEPNTSEESASLFPLARPTPTTTVSLASANLASNYKMDSV